MSKRTGVVCFLLLAGLFLIVNRAAYKGYFQADEFDTMGWAQVGSANAYLIGVLSPRFSPINFRPTAHFYFHEAVLHFGLDFPKYVLIVHMVHLLNVWLLWLLVRKLGAGPAAAALACFFFAFHMALFDDIWKPMYIYDVLCGTFCLLSLLCFARRWWIHSFCCYWVAYKSKELAVMLPVALACYEIWFGKKQWKPLVPFFLASLSFGLQGLLLNPNKNNEYTFRFTFDALRKSSIFYAGRVLLIPYLGFVVPLAAMLARNRRTWMGLVWMGSLMVPLLFLPGRLLSAYCYAPFIGLAVVLAGVAEVSGALPVALLILVWLPLDLRELRANRSITLTRDDEVRHWMSGLQKFAATKPRFEGVSWAGRIPGFADWGVNGALAVVFPYVALQVHHFDGPEQPAFERLERVAYLVWDRQRLSSAVRTQPAADCSYLRMNEASGVWQLDQGWNDVDGDHRWSSPRAEVRLERPAGTVRFVLRAIVPWPQITSVGPVRLHVQVNGVPLEPRQLDHGGDADVEWDLPPSSAGLAHVIVEAEPLYQPGVDALGVAVQGLGFATR
jgi:hypothetical protein